MRRSGWAVTVPLPTSQAAVGYAEAAVVRHLPPSIDALASRPAGRLIVRSFGESAPVSDPELENERFSPRLCEPPALVPALWFSDIEAVEVAIAAGTATAAASVTAAMTRRRCQRRICGPFMGSEPQVGDGEVQGAALPGRAAGDHREAELLQLLLRRLPAQRRGFAQTLRGHRDGHRARRVAEGEHQVPPADRRRPQPCAPHREAAPDTADLVDRVAAERQALGELDGEPAELRALGGVDDEPQRRPAL